MIIMGDSKFFDESIIDSIDTKDYPILKNAKNLVYNIKRDKNTFSFFLEIDDQRLNTSEMKGILIVNEKEKFLKECDKALINYLVHKLADIQTILKFTNDTQLIFEYLKLTDFEILYNEKKIDFRKENEKLNFNLKLDEQSNVILELLDEGEFIYGEDLVYFVKEDKIYTLDNSLSLKFYKEIILGNNKFTIDSFINIKDSFLDKLKENHNLKSTKEIEDLTNLSLEEKVAPIVLEISKTAHFIALEFKYKIGEEVFPIDEYKYAETLSWVDKPTLIKIIRENEKLVKYVSDLTFTEFVFDDAFMDTRVKLNRNSKNPFQVMLPISSLENVVRRIIPMLEKKFTVEYKDKNPLELNTETVRFELDTVLNSRLDLFEFKVKFKVKEDYFDLEFLKNLMLQNRKFVQLSDGTTANIENIREINKWIEFLSKFEFKRSGQLYKTKSSVALELDEFLEDIKEKKLTSNQEYKNLIQELKDKNPIEKIEIPDEVKGILREYQKEGVYWLHFLKKYGFGGILADEMGLGKTIQALSILKMNSGKTHLVVCPKSLMYNWENEIKKYFPSMKVLVIDKDSEKRKQLINEVKNYDVVVTSYSMLQKDYAEYIEKNVEFNYMIMDEAHYVKNIKTLSSKAVRIIPAERKILLTGTPLENNLDELYGTFELIMPGYLGSKLEFRRDFVSKIERNNTIALEILQSKIKPFILRRTKKQVLTELPEKQEQVVFNEMTNKQVGIYNEVLNRVRIEVNQLVKDKGFDRVRIQVLSALLKLRQICNHPSLVDKSFTDEDDISGKYEQFLDLLTETIESGEKVLVFSQFTSMLDIIQKELEKRKVNFLRLDGSTKNRQDVVDKFNEDENVKLFLISLKAGGVGLNLTSASTVFLYDPWWNPMVEQQAIDRTHRIGQKKRVNIYKFITRNSIEEKILKLQERKGNMFENLVSADDGFFKRLEWEDLMELFDE